MTSDAFAGVGAGRFALLTTFRRNGDGVATPVWIATDADGALLVTTPSASGKVKRLRRDPRVLLSPCGRLGRVPFGAPVVEGRAEVLGPEADHPAQTDALRRKLGAEYSLVTAVEARSRRRRREVAERLIIRISQPGAATGT